MVRGNIEIVEDSRGIAELKVCGIMGDEPSKPFKRIMAFLSECGESAAWAIKR